jgi:hypothetical protein
MAGPITPIIRGWEHLKPGESLHIPGLHTRGRVQLAVAGLNRAVGPARQYRYYATRGGCRIFRME